MSAELSATTFCTFLREFSPLEVCAGGTRNVRMRRFRVPGRCFRSFPLVQTRVLRSRADFLRIMAFCLGCTRPVIFYGPFGRDESPVSQRRMRKWRELAQESPECRGGQHGRSFPILAAAARLILVLFELMARQSPALKQLSLSY